MSAEPEKGGKMPSKVYRTARGLGRGLRKAQANARDFGSAFKTGLKRGLRTPKNPSGKSQSHLRKHWAKYAQAGAHIAGSGVAYGVGIKHGVTLRAYDPQQRAGHKRIMKAHKKLNKTINEAIRDSGY